MKKILATLNIVCSFFWLMIISFIFFFPTLLGASPAVVPSSSDLEPESGINALNKIVPPHNPDRSMLQFMAEGHILGFQPKKVYLAGLDHALWLEFLGTPGVMPETETNIPSTGNTAKAAALAKVVYKNLWQGINLQYEATKDGITESTYHVEPGADISKIRLRYNVPVKLRKDGSLQFAFAGGYLTESRPVAWQEIGGKRAPVTVAFKISGQEIGFNVGPYDNRRALIIDPTYAWHTFYGSAYGDQAIAMAMDGSGNIYVTGYSYGTWGTPINAHSGSYEICVMKLNNSGAYQWHTFYGSSGDDYGYGIALDTGGNIYVTGISMASWGAPLHGHSGERDFFVLKLNNSGTYQWHTFFGSSSDDYAYGIATDGSGNVYVAGYSWDTWGIPLNDFSGYNADVFVLKLDTNGGFLWNTFQGSSTMGDYAKAIALDDSGNIYIAGYSRRTIVVRESVGGTVQEGRYVISSWGTPLNAESGSSDIFVLKLDAVGAYQWHTFYGSSDSDEASSIAVDSSGNVYVAGQSFNTWGSPVHAINTEGDMVILKLDASGTYQWHTFFGANLEDYAYGIAVDGSGNTYVTGYSQATWDSPLNAYSGSQDLVVLKLDGNGAYQWHTFFGSSSSDYGKSITSEGDGTVYVAGHSLGSWGSPLHAKPGNTDLTVLKLESDCLYTLSKTAVSTDSPSAQSSVDVTASGSSCFWTATSNDSWITVTSGSSGGGSGTVSYHVDANTSANSRIGTITIAWQTYTIVQSGTAPSSDTVQKAYIGYYQRPADPAGLIWWANYLVTHGGGLSAIIEAFANSDESKALYGSINSSNIASVIDAIYRALFNRSADTAGRDWYVAGFNEGTFTAATIMLNILYGAQNDDLATLGNKLIVSNLFTRTIDPELDGATFQATYAGDADAIAARYFLSLVMSAASSVPTQSQITDFIKSYIADTGDPILTPLEF